MQWCLDPATIGFDVPPQTYLAAAQAAGFTLVEFPATWLAALAVDQASRRACFDQAGVAFAQFTCGLGVPGNLAVPAELFHQRMIEAKPLWQAAAELGCRRASLFFHTERHDGTHIDVAEAARRVALVAAALQPFQIRLSVGFVDEYLLRAAPTILADSDARLLVDTFSLHRAGLDANWLATLPMDSIGWFRAADAPTAENPASLGYEHRLLPGTGVLDLAAMWQACRARGYRGPVSIEVRDPVLETMSPQQRASAGIAALQRALG